MATFAQHDVDLHEGWKSVYPKEVWRRIIGEGIYLLCVLTIAVVVTVILLRFREILASHEYVERLLICALGGIAGSWLFAMKWYVRAVTRHIWSFDHVIWRLSSPVMGIFLSVSTYAMIQSGLLGITFATTNTGGTPPAVAEKMYAYAIGFLVGLCSDVVMGKVTEVAETVFGKSVPNVHKT